MEYQIKTSPNFLSHFEIIKSFKRILKPIKTDKKGNFIDQLFKHPEIIYKYISHNFGIQEIDEIDIKCDIYYNISLTSTAWFGKNGGNSCIGEKCEKGFMTVFENKKELEDVLKSDYLPEKIAIKRIELKQEILNTKSKFEFEIFD